MNREKIIIDREYATLIQDLKATVQTAHLRAHRAVNAELIRMYWQVSKTLLERQKIEAWGSKYLERVSQNLTAAFPGMRGFSTVKIKRMRMLASRYPNEIGSQAVTQLPWSHVIELMFKIKDIKTLEWYAQQFIKEGWSRNVLTLMIKSDLYSRQADAPKINNFKERLSTLKQPKDLKVFHLPKQLSQESRFIICSIKIKKNIANLKVYLPNFRL